MSVGMNKEETDAPSIAIDLNDLGRNINMGDYRAENGETWIPDQEVHRLSIIEENRWSLGRRLCLEHLWDLLGLVTLY